MEKFYGQEFCLQSGLATSYPSSSLINFTENDGINFHGVIPRNTIFYQLDDKGQSQEQPFPSICVSSQDAEIEWKDTLIDFVGDVSVQIDNILSNNHLRDTSALIRNFIVDEQMIGDFPTPRFDLPDTSCIASDIVLTDLPDDGFDQYNWTFKSSNNPKSDTREPDAVTYSDAGTFQVTLITDQDNCLDTFSREIVIVDAPEFDLGKDLTLCEKESTELNAFSEDIQTYTWADGTTTPTLAIDRSGRYNITVTDDYCTVEDSINVTFIAEQYPNFKIDPGSDTTLCIGATYQLKVDSKEIESLIWNDGDNQAEKSISEAGIYQVTAFIGDCPFEADVTVDFKDCSSQVFIPNAFSPNGDGNNEELLIGGKNITLVAVQIFDRWGNLIFDDITRPWNGKINGDFANKGTYVYQVIYIEELTGKRKLATGTVSLVR
ncbi:MAG: gliding motility-associated C-terminal domain-containing protein [Bacteroidota bacterium]